MLKLIVFVRYLTHIKQFSFILATREYAYHFNQILVQTMSSKFQEALITDVDGIISLPLLHTCDAFAFRSILDNGALIPQMCDVFSSDLLYTYYGIPSYRTNYSLATTNPAMHMICIILNSEEIDEIYKIYPFDSGAFERLPLMKETFFHPKNKILDFEVENSLNGAKKVIKTFYETNDNYVAQRPKVNKKFNELAFEAINYHTLISEKGNSILDDRASSIEIIFDKNIPLTKNTVKQIIIPNSFKDDDYTRNLIKKKLNIEDPIGYSTFRGNPRDNFGAIRSEYFKFINN
jgi:hypothetical protein